MITKQLRLPLNSLSLKLLAMALMFTDHIYHAVFPQYTILNIIGRLAFPIFAFQFVEGCLHTRSPSRMLARLALFALISELPFDLTLYHSWWFPHHQNIIFTLLIAAIGIHVMENVRQTNNATLYILTAAAMTSLCGGLGSILYVDYGSSGIFTVFLFYFFRRHRLRFAWVGQLAGMLYIHSVLLVSYPVTFTFGETLLRVPIQSLAVFALLPIWLYNGKPGLSSKPIQYACYAFYPLHLLLLAALSPYAEGVAGVCRFIV